MISPKTIMRKTARVLLALFFLAFVSYFCYERFITCNFHTVTAGEAYRSAQMDRDKLEHYIGKCSIRSVINLRGHKPAKQWYRDELSVCSALGVKHYDVRLSAVKELTGTQIEKITAIFKEAPRPVLIHCRAGADRAALVSAMWKAEVDGKPAAEAKKQLTIFYGHIPFSKTRAMDRSFEKWISNGRKNLIK